jgi:hypothetical protein|tara:strand:- start:3203 stop:3367 length:165 start_codon:yes stop_codon:yes gene_type:complete
MKWEVRKVGKKWGVFLQQKYCKTDEPVCYSVSITEDGAKSAVDRLNNPLHKEEI